MYLYAYRRKTGGEYRGINPEEIANHTAPQTNHADGNVTGEELVNETQVIKTCARPFPWRGE